MQAELSLLEQVKSGKVWQFPGGIHPPERKDLSNQGDITPLPVGKRFYVPIKQHIGAKGDLLVKEGQRVLAGQPLTLSKQGLVLPVHAPTSGVIEAITEHVSAHPSGIPELTIIIEADGKDEFIQPQPLSNWRDNTKIEVLGQLQDMGVAGLGGAAFPTYGKASEQNIELLIINAVECEPYITADDVLMRQYAKEIISGVEILQQLHQANLAIIAIEDNKPEAIESVKQAIEGKTNIELRVVPTKYPSGGEKQLIQIVTGQQVPTGQLPAQLGIVMQNVGTCYATYQAIELGKPLIERVVTVTGESILKPQNLWVRLGTPVEDLVTYTGITPEFEQRLIMGGPMMGFGIMDKLTPVVKATNCILAPTEYFLPSRQQEQACIRCSMCADACPAELLPQQLLWYAKDNDHDKLEEYNLKDCIECGACAYVCPSQIPLVQYYRTAKVDIRLAEEEKIKAEKAKQRFEARQARLERDKQARLEKHKAAAEKRKQALEKDDGAKDKIAAALARAKAKKEAAADSANTSPANDDAPKDKVAAAIARAKAKKAAANNEPKSDEAPVDDKKAKVAEAIARAKAKKAAANNDAEQNDVEIQTEQSQAEQPVVDDKKAKVAEAIARAKAKKAAKQAEAENAATPDADNQTEQTDESSADELSAEEIKKQKVAAAIAKAKAKKQQAEADETTAEQPKAELSEEEIKKQKVAAAIAKAKAKKAAAKSESNQQD